MAMDNTIEIEDKAQGIKDKVGEKLGQFGRSLKKIDLRGTIVSNPYPAIGIAFAAGAIVGLVRPKPQAGRITSLLFTTVGAIAFRLVREAAVKELGAYAKNRFLNQDQASTGYAGKSEGGNVRYSPSV